MHLEVQVEGQIVLGFFVEMAILDAPCHVSTDEIAEEGGSQSEAESPYKGVFQLGDADIQIAIC